MNNAINFSVFLQLLGVAVIIAEIILPSGGILSILATGLFGYSLYIMFTQISTTAGVALVVADLILIPILVYFGLRFLAKSPVTLRARLSKEDGVTSQSADQDRYLGRQGVTVSDLRPSGVAILDGERMDVVTQGEYVEKQVEIIVIAVRGNQIVVKEKR